MRFGIKTIDDFSVEGKTVLCRVDMNQPVDKATDTLKSINRIRACAPTLKELSDKGAKVVVDHRWVNIGWGYCPNNIKPWNYRYKPAFALLDGDGSPVAVFVDNDAEPSEWIKGAPTDYRFTFKLKGVPAGEYVWAVGLVDTTKVHDGIPEIGLRMAVSPDLTTSCGWARLSPVTVE